MSAGISRAGLPRARASAAGSSLIEAMVCVGIMGIVTSGMYAFFLASNQSYGDQAVVSRMVWNANNAMRQITQDLRQAGVSPALAPCVSLLPRVVIGSNLGGGSLTVGLVLDDPARRTELTGDQPKGGNPAAPGNPFAVLSTAGYEPQGDKKAVAYLTDGTQCTRLTVVGVSGGLQHESAKDANTTDAATPYTYVAAKSLVYRQAVERRVAYAVDSSDSRTPWLTRDTNDGNGPQRLVPDIQSLTVSYLMADGSTPDVSTIATAAGALNIRSVTVSLVARADASTRNLTGQAPSRTQALSATVKLRNLGL